MWTEVTAGLAASQRDKWTEWHSLWVETVWELVRRDEPKLGRGTLSNAVAVVLDGVLVANQL